MVFEMSGQVTLIGKARREGDLRDRHPCSKQVPCTVDAHLGQISVWWQTYLGTECPDQGERVELSNGSKLIERNRLCVIGMQIVFHQSNSPLFAAHQWWVRRRGSMSSDQVTQRQGESRFTSQSIRWVFEQRMESKQEAVQVCIFNDRVREKGQRMGTSWRLQAKVLK